MKILLVNKFYYPKGGAEKYLFALEKLLRDQGHEVRILATKSPLNLPHPDSSFFVGYDDLDALPLVKKITEVFKIFYRSEVNKKLDLMIANWRPDLVHLNNINYQIGTNIIDYFAAKKIPLVITLHDYQLISPNYTLYNPKHDCWQAALNKKYYQCLIHKCYQGSSVKSCLAVLESYYNHCRKIYAKIGALIAPSNFLAAKFIECDFAENKINYLPNFLETLTDQKKPIAKGDFYLYAGRLTAEKGVLELIEVFKNQPNWNLKIAGQGPLNLPALKNIELLGQLPARALNSLLGQAKALILPSKWPENCPYSVLEALAVGTPVIAKNVGGIKELVINGDNGLLFNQFSELPNMIAKFEADPVLRKSMSARALAESVKYNSENYYQKLIAIYSSLI